MKANQQEIDFLLEVQNGLQNQLSRVEARLETLISLGEAATADVIEFPVTKTERNLRLAPTPDDAA